MFASRVNFLFIPTLFSQIRIRSTVFTFITVSIWSLYNGGLKNGNFVVKIYDVKKNHVLLLTVKISKATSTSLLALVQSEVSSHKATSSPTKHEIVR
jgi:hypothetical protein